MTVSLALEYIPRRMCELGYENNYHIRFRHLLLMPGEERAIAAYNQLFILIEPTSDMRIESDVGLFDLSEDMINEFQYEHTGEVHLTNLSPVSGHVRFIQVIPNK
ncbi:MAG: hypothetical protein ABI675_15110 [Chitinophagaceae bacterium]